MNYRVLRVLVLSAAFGGYACHGQTQPTSLVNAFPGLTFSYPVFLTHAGDGSHRLFVVEQTGRIKVFPNDSAAAGAAVFLNIANKLSAGSGEEGLLGLAFDPNYAANGFFYVDYTAPNPLRTVIARYHVPPGTPDKADSLSEFVLLEINQPFTNHNGGMVAFGPDGYLYIGMGDGGSGNDPDNRAQDSTQLLGKILRIDVSDSSAQRHYLIPPDNPYAGNTTGVREELWAIGLRNPWRWSFDNETGLLWCGDVGQDTREEVDVIVKGGNYGWKIMEGLICRPGGGNCDTAGLIKPLVDYTHSFGNAITGGYIYRGYRRPDLSGGYVYADYSSGRIWFLRWNGSAVTLDTLLTQASFSISSFGEDEFSELYLIDYSSSGRLYRFDGASRPTTGVEDNILLPQGTMSLAQNFPNPFNPTTVVSYELPSAGSVRLVVYDLLGHAVATLVDMEQAAGRYSVRWDARSVPTGVYVAVLKQGGHALTKKMMVLR
jgi:glucose/arabinose dehydrogenase